MKPQCSIRVASMALIASLLSACGGGSATNISSQSVTYTAAASAGELVKYTIDTTELTYSYEITQSAYGLKGKTGAGTLTKNADGSYGLSGIEKGKIAVLESGLMLGSIVIDADITDPENKSSPPYTVPVLGATQAVTSAADAAGTYNYVSRRYTPSTDWVNDYGTLKINADGTWESCSETNLGAANASCSTENAATGTIDSWDLGLASLKADGNTAQAGSVFVFKDAVTGQRALFIDLNGKTSMGAGAFYGAAQESLPKNVDGRWHYIHSNGLRGYVDVKGTAYSDYIGSEITPYKANLEIDTPWKGFARTSDSAGILMPTGSGMYAGYFEQVGTISIGIRP